MSQSETTIKNLIINVIKNQQQNIISDKFIRSGDLKDTILLVIDGIKKWHFWWALAVAEIKRRYQRTSLGPFWTSLNLGIFIGLIGTLFSVLWKTNLHTFLPYFTSGYISWIFISNIISESCTTFIAVEGLLKNLPLNYTSFAWNLVTRNLLVLCHHFAIYLLVMIFLNISFNRNIFLIFPALFLISLTGFSVSIILGLICARFRDIQQLINSVLQICLFFTPILWSVDQFKGTKIDMLIQFNPLYHYIKILRDPLLGQATELLTWFITMGLTLFFLCFAILFLARYYRKLIYWL